MQSFQSFLLVMNKKLQKISVLISSVYNPCLKDSGSGRASIIKSPFDTALLSKLQFLNLSRERRTPLDAENIKRDASDYKTSNYGLQVYKRHLFYILLSHHLNMRQQILFAIVIVPLPLVL